MSTKSYYHTTAQGFRLFMEETGSGPLMVLMHGLGGLTNVFELLIRHFSAQYTMLRFDFFGSGLSYCATDTKLSIPYFLKDLEDIVASRDSPQETILVGHSLGSIVAMHYAAKHVKTRGLVLIGAGRSAAHIPAVVNRMEEMASKARNGIEFMTDSIVANNLAPDSSDLARAMVRQMISTQNPEGYAATCEAISNSSHVDPDYSCISCPCILVAGMGQEKRKMVLVAVVKSAHQHVLEDTEGVVEAMKIVLAEIE